MTPIDLVLERLPSAKRCGENWRALCPAHQDRRASLSIGRGDDGRALLHCHAGCGLSNIIQKLGLTMADLFPESRRPRPCRSRR